MARYVSNANRRHGVTPCMGVLVTNLGTPDAPTTQAVRRYLKEFLADPRVIEAPRFLWWFVLNGFILSYRSKRSAAVYRKIWTSEGSPLLVNAKKQVVAIQDYLDKHEQQKFHVELGMRYGQPSIADGLHALQQMHAKKIIVLPLYPQYSATTTATTFDAVANVLKTWRNIPELHIVKHYHDQPDYIEALAASIRQNWQQKQRPSKVLFSFHGLPKSYFDAGDPYYCECCKTAKLVAEKLALSKEEWMVTFQSRFGSKQWLQPYTDKTLKSLAVEGVKCIAVVCPGFSSDCLETLAEINMLNREIFLDAGGESFSYIPALNDQCKHIEALANIIRNCV